MTAARGLDRDADAIVVGAGPAGASVAYHLASRGRSVLLLDRQRFPRDKSCGDGLTPYAVRLLDEMGVLRSLVPAREVRGGRLLMRGRGRRDFVYPEDDAGGGRGLVVPRYLLDDAIRRQAIAAGAEPVEEALVTHPLVEDGVVVGVALTRGGEPATLRAPVVVAADGAASRLARHVRGGAADATACGTAIRAYFDDIDDLPELLEIYMPLMDVTDRYVLPSYGWVFPTGPQSANVGVGVFERAHGANVRELMDRFVGELRAADPRFARMRQAGASRGAPLRFDFAPERCHAPGLLLVGDAAGLVSPFTGEGISYALESGRLAAEVIDRALRPGRARLDDLSAYGLLLEQHFAGYFEVGRHSARRYHLVWHVLDGTFDNDRPLFALCRQAVLFPEGVGETRATRVLDDVGPLVAPGPLTVREDLLRVGEVVLDAVRRDWPVLGRVTAAGRGDPGVPFRPALLLLLASYAGDPRAPHLARVAAAVELGYLAALAQLSVSDEDPRAGDARGSANWGNMLAVIAGDFLLTKAYRLCAGAGREVSLCITAALARVCEGRLEEARLVAATRLDETAYLDALAKRTATLFELPCRLGALLAGASAPHAAALAEYGRTLGMAFALADEALSLTGEESRLGRTTGTTLRASGYGHPVLRALARGDAHAATLRRHLDGRRTSQEEVAAACDLLVACGARDETLAAARAFSRRAVAATGALPDGAARRTLARLAMYAVDRGLPARRRAERLLETSGSGA